MEFHTFLGGLRHSSLAYCLSSSVACVDCISHDSFVSTRICLSHGVRCDDRQFLVRNTSENGLMYRSIVLLRIQRGDVGQRAA